MLYFTDTTLMNHTFSRFALALSVILISQFAYAQTVTDTLEVSNGNSCTTLTYGMSLGSRDSRTNGQVSDLQAYLQAGGYLSGDPTGYFGALTKKAVQKFQSANGITSNGMVGPYTRGKIKELSCRLTPPNTEVSTYPSATSSAPSISVLQIPSLKLEYSPEGGEAVLVASYTINVVAGDKAISASALSGGSPAGIVLKKANGEATNVSVTLSADGPTIVQPGNSAVYRVNGRVDPKKLFAGAYYMEMIPVLYTMGQANQSVATEVKPLGSTATNYRTVLGEVSPYITKITCDATPNINCTIHGVRFDSEANSVTVNGVTKSLPSFNSGTSISFIASDFGITTAGTYYTQVSARRGASNGHMVTVGTPTQNSSVPVVEFLNTPTLRLGYDGQEKETMLMGMVTIKVTTGNAPIKMYRHAVPTVLQFNNALQAVSANSMLFISNPTGVTLGANSVDTIPANSIATFSVTNTVKASELFAGSYTMKPANFYYIDNNDNSNSVQYTSFKNVDSSNSVTIVGEVSPYISSVAMENGAIVVKGARLNLNGNIPTIDGVKKDIGATVTSSSISIPTQENGIASGGHSIQVLNAITGDSNRVYVTVDTTTPTPPKYAYTFPSTADKVSKMAVGIIPFDLSYDITKDGKVTSADALAYLGTDSIPNALTNTDKAYIALRMSVGTAPVDMRFDITGDGKVTSADSIAFSKLDSTVTEPSVVAPTTSNTSSSIITPTTTVKPTVTVLASPLTVSVGGQTRITWSSQNATACSWTEGDNQFKLYENTVSGTSRYTSSISATQRYTLTCENASGSTSASVTINVTSSTSTSQVLGVSAVCVNLPYNMHRGNETPNVKKLQEFLVAQGLLEEVTGFYGDKTVSAVKEYQMNKGLPVTGMVYDFTRMAISSETCQ